MRARSSGADALWQLGRAALVEGWLDHALVSVFDDARRTPRFLADTGWRRI